MYVLPQAKDILDGEAKSMSYAFPDKDILSEVEVSYKGKSQTAKELLTITNNVQARASITRSESLLMSTILANDDKTKKRVMEVTAGLTAKLSRPWFEVVDRRVAELAKAALEQEDPESKKRSDKSDGEVKKKRKR